MLLSSGEFNFNDNIQACIVRIMKDRKHLTHTDLVNETVKQMAGRFTPEPILIKRRIENLIEASRYSTSVC